jgi:hypothetical protein
VLVPVTLTVSPAPVTTMPQITTPMPDSVLPGSSVTFQWTTNGATVKRWHLYVGSTQGAKDVYDSGKFNGSLSKTVSALPTDGRTVWVQLRFDVDGNWQSADFKYIAALR